MASAAERMASSCGTLSAEGIANAAMPPFLYRTYGPTAMLSPLSAESFSAAAILNQVPLVVPPVVAPAIDLKVLHVVNGEHFSGAERVQSHLGRCLPSHGIATDFVCVKPGKFAAMIDQKNGDWGVGHQAVMSNRFDLRSLPSPRLGRTEPLRTAARSYAANGNDYGDSCSHDRRAVDLSRPFAGCTRFAADDGQQSQCVDRTAVAAKLCTPDHGFRKSAFGLHHAGCR